MCREKVAAERRLPSWQGSPHRLTGADEGPIRMVGQSEGSPADVLRAKLEQLVRRQREDLKGQGLPVAGNA